MCQCRETNTGDICESLLECEWYFEQMIFIFFLCEHQLLAKPPQQTIPFYVYTYVSAWHLPSSKTDLPNTDFSLYTKQADFQKGMVDEHNKNKQFFLSEAACFYKNILTKAKNNFAVEPKITRD